MDETVMITAETSGLGDASVTRISKMPLLAMAGVVVVVDGVTIGDGLPAMKVKYPNTLVLGPADSREAG